MPVHSSAEEKFLQSMVRAHTLCDLHAHLSGSLTAAIDTSDLLRASVVQSISALDFLIHELVRLEVQRRLKSGEFIERLEVPLRITQYDGSLRPLLVDNFIREANSFKSFVDPDKLSDAVRPFISEPWGTICAHAGRPPKDFKTRIKFIYKWRNRIAHEADINPAYAGVRLYEIDPDDVRAALEDVELLGRAVVGALTWS